MRAPEDGRRARGARRGGRPGGERRAAAAWSRRRPHDDGARHGGAWRAPIRIANCSGFFGDRLSAAREMVEGGPIDVLTGDWLAELTMLILARTRMKRPGGGYAHTFVTPDGAGDGHLPRPRHQGGHERGRPRSRRLRARRRARSPQKLGLHPKIAYVRGDDLMPRIAELIARASALRHFETGEPIKDASAFLTANAYLGCWGIVDALERGADIVITGRVTDAAIVCGPAAWHHGWTRTDWNALAGAVVAGHVIECGTQATGGNYSFFTEIPGLERAGFPWAEIARGRLLRDRQARRHRRRGLDRHRDVAAALRDRRARVPRSRRHRRASTRSGSSRSAPDRVRMHGVRGEPPPPTLKVCLNRHGGFRNDLTFVLTGLDIEAKAKLIEAAFWARVPVPARATSRRSPRASSAPTRPTRDQRAGGGDAWYLGVKDRDEREGRPRLLERDRSRSALATIPGFFGLSGGPARGVPTACTSPRCVPAASRAAGGGAARRRDARCRSVIPPRRDVAVSAARRGRRASAPGGADGARAARPRLRRALRRQGRQREPRRLRAQRRGLGLARRASSPSSACASCCPRWRRSRSTATGCPRCARSTS